jgi:exonuclease III
MEFGYASGTMLRTLADLEPLLDDPELGESVLLAGDWNIGTWWGKSDAKYAEREGAFLQLLEAYGFVDCLDLQIPGTRGRLEGCACELGDGCRHLATFMKDRVPYMDDYVFATRPLADNITSATVAPEWTWQSDLSDHAPLIVDWE